LAFGSGNQAGNRESNMLTKVLKIFAILLVPIAIFTVTANAAGGGGGAEPMPGTNFTDMPSYQPRPIEPLSRIRHVRKDMYRPDRSAAER
jgi:hypothetical protein